MDDGWLNDSLIQSGALGIPEEVDDIFKRTKDLLSWSYGYLRILEKETVTQKNLFEFLSITYMVDDLIRESVRSLKSSSSAKDVVTISANKLPSWLAFDKTITVSSPKTRTFTNISFIADHVIASMLATEENLPMEPSYLSLSYFLDCIWNTFYDGEGITTSKKDEIKRRFGFSKLEEEFPEHGTDGLLVLLPLLLFFDTLRNIAYFGFCLLHKTDGFSGFLANMASRSKIEIDETALFGTMKPNTILNSFNHMASFYINLVMTEQRIGNVVDPFINELISEPNMSQVNFSWSSYNNWKSWVQFDDSLEERIFNTTTERNERTKTPFGSFSVDMPRHISDLFTARPNQAPKKPWIPFQLYIAGKKKRLESGGLPGFNQNEVQISIDQSVWGVDEDIDIQLLLTLGLPTRSVIPQIQKTDSFLYLRSSDTSPPKNQISQEIYQTINSLSQFQRYTQTKEQLSQVHKKWKDKLTYRDCAYILDSFLKQIATITQWERQLTDQYQDILEFVHPFLENGVFFDGDKHVEEKNLAQLVGAGKKLTYVSFLQLYNLSNSKRSPDLSTPGDIATLANEIFRTMFQPISAYKVPLPTQRVNEVKTLRHFKRMGEIISGLKKFGTPSISISLIPVIVSKATWVGKIGEEDVGTTIERVYAAHHNCEVVPSNQDDVIYSEIDRRFNTTTNPPPTLEEFVLGIGSDFGERHMIALRAKDKTFSSGFNCADTFFRYFKINFDETNESSAWSLSGESAIPISGLKATFNKKVYPDAPDILRSYYDIVGNGPKDLDEDNSIGPIVSQEISLDIPFHSISFKGEGKIKSVWESYGKLVNFTSIDDGQALLVNFDPNPLLDGSECPFPITTNVKPDKITPIQIGFMKPWFGVDISYMIVRLNVENVRNVFGLGVCQASLSLMGWCPPELGLFGDSSVLMQEKDRTVNCSEEAWDCLRGKKNTTLLPHIKKLSTSTSERLFTQPTAMAPSWDGYKNTILKEVVSSSRTAKYSTRPKGFECYYPTIQNNEEDGIFKDSVVFQRAKNTLSDELNLYEITKDRLKDPDVGFDLIESIKDLLSTSGFKINQQFINDYISALSDDKEDLSLVSDVLQLENLEYVPSTIFYPALRAEAMKTKEDLHMERKFPNLLYDKDFFEGEKKEIGGSFGWLPVSFYKLRQQLLGWSVDVELDASSGTSSPTEIDMGSLSSQKWSKPTFKVVADPSEPYWKVQIQQLTQIGSGPENLSSKAAFYLSTISPNSISSNPACYPNDITNPLISQSPSDTKPPITNAIFKKQRIMLSGGLDNDELVNRFMDANCEAVSVNPNDVPFSWGASYLRLDFSEEESSTWPITDQFVAPLFTNVVDIDSWNVQLVSRVLPNDHPEAVENQLMPYLGLHNVDKWVNYDLEPWSKPLGSEDSSLLLEWIKSTIVMPTPRKLRVPNSGVSIVQKWEKNLFKTYKEIKPPKMPGVEFNRAVFNRRKIIGKNKIETMENYDNEWLPNQYYQNRDNYEPLKYLTLDEIIKGRKTSNKDIIQAMRTKDGNYETVIGGDVAAILEFVNGARNQDNSFLFSDFLLPDIQTSSERVNLELDLIRNANNTIATVFLGLCTNSAINWLKPFLSEEKGVLLSELYVVLDNNLDFQKTTPFLDKLFSASAIETISPIIIDNVLKEKHSLPKESPGTHISKEKAQKMKRTRTPLSGLSTGLETFNAVTEELGQNMFGGSLDNLSMIKSGGLDEWTIKTDQDQRVPYRVQKLDTTGALFVVNSENFEGAVTYRFLGGDQAEISAEKKPVSEVALKKTDREELVRLVIGFLGVYPIPSIQYLMEIFTFLDKSKGDTIFHCTRDPLSLSVLARSMGVNYFAASSYGSTNDALSILKPVFEGTMESVKRLMTMFIHNSQQYVEEYGESVITMPLR